MGGAVKSISRVVSSVVSPVTSLVGGTLGGASQDLGLTTGGATGVTLNTQSFKLSDEEKAFEAELKKRYQGDGPTVAQNALKAATDRNISNIAAQAASQRSNQALVQREALRAQQQTGQELANQNAQLRSQEMQAAESSYGTAVQRPRLAAQEAEALRVGVGRNNADRDMQSKQFNAQATGGIFGGIGSTLTGSDENSKTNKKLISGETYKMKPFKTEEKTEEEKSQERRDKAAKGIEAATTQSAAGKAGFAAGKGMSQIFSAVSQSDKSKKENLQDSNPAKDFLNKLKAYSFDYKDPKAPGASEGKQLGVMAQDLEKSEIGKKMVIDTPTGKMVDFGKAIAPMLASQVIMNNELEGLKKALTKKNKKG